jgi:hypothetical protein
MTWGRLVGVVVFGSVLMVAILQYCRSSIPDSYLELSTIARVVFASFLAAAFFQRIRFLRYPKVLGGFPFLLLIADAKVLMYLGVIPSRTIHELLFPAVNLLLIIYFVYFLTIERNDDQYKRGRSE